nr:unnamed protein product [Callosobruchus analis]
MSSCAVGNCKNYSRVTKGSNRKYFREDKINLNNGSFEVPLKERLLNCEKANSRHLKPNAIPTLNSLKNYKRPN